jgi:hypothetical protein
MVSICVQDFSVAKGALVELPTDEISAGVGTGLVSCRLSDGDNRGGGRYRGGGLQRSR